MYLLDTDILTLIYAGHPKVLERRQTVPNDQIVITLITRIEVLQGRFDFVLKAEDGNQWLHAQQLLERTEERLRMIPTLPIDTGAAEFDRLRKDKKLKKVGRADLLIAAIALANRATLVTRNLRHFRQVPGLQLENWAD
jgi:tRNA(fMet)-specific endonuclease VapC